MKTDSHTAVVEPAGRVTVAQSLGGGESPLPDGGSFLDSSALPPRGARGGGAAGWGSALLERSLQGAPAGRESARS